MTFPQLAGIPLLLDGWRLTEVDLNRLPSVVLRYEDTQDEGHVDIILSPDSRSEGRARNVAARCEGDFGSRSFEFRTRAKELASRVNEVVEGFLAQAEAPRFPEGLCERSVPDRVARNVVGVRALLPELLEGGWVLDCYPGSRPSSVALELGSRGGPLTVLELGPPATGGGSRCFSTSRRELSSRSEASAGVTGSGVLGVAQLLLTLRGEPPRVIEDAHDRSLTSWPASPGSWVSSDVHERNDEALRREQERLASSLSAVESFFDEAVTAEGFGGDGVRLLWPLAERTGPDQSWFPLAPHPFRHRRVLIEYLRQLGYWVTADGRLRGVPTPESLRRALRRRGIVGSGYRPRLVAVDSLKRDTVQALELYSEGTLGIEVGTPALYRQTSALLALRTPNELWSEHLTGVPRALSEVMLSTHRVPFSVLGEFGATASPLITKARTAARGQALAPLLQFFERDLVDVCLRTWQELARPDDFADAFAERRGELDRALGMRIRECEQRLENPAGARSEELVSATRIGVLIAKDAWHSAKGGLRRLFRARAEER